MADYAPVLLDEKAAYKETRNLLMANLENTTEFTDPSAVIAFIAETTYYLQTGEFKNIDEIQRDK